MKQALSTKAESELKLRQLAAKGNISGIKALLSTYPGLNINAAGPKSGRTALHNAARYEQPETLRFLVSRGADPRIKDHAGFLAGDLVLNPLPYTGASSASVKTRRERFVEAFTPTLRYNGIVIFHVETIEQMQRLIDDNSQYDKIGFVVETPNIIKLASKNSHVIPLLYLRRSATKESFISFDSSLLSFLPIPVKPGVDREVVFSPFSRQASNTGCFREAFLVLIHAFLDPGLLRFVNTHSKAVPRLLTPLTRAEIAPVPKGVPNSLDEIIQKGQIMARLNFEKANLYYRDCGGLASNVRILTRPPLWLLRFIENFQILRVLKARPEFQAYLSRLATHADTLATPFLSRETGEPLTIDERRRCVLSCEKADDFNLYHHASMARLPITPDHIDQAKALLSKTTRGETTPARREAMRVSTSRQTLFTVSAKGNSKLHRLASECDHLNRMTDRVFEAIKLGLPIDEWLAAEERERPLSARAC